MIEQAAYPNPLTQSSPLNLHMMRYAGTFVEGEKLDQQAQVKLKPGTRFSLGTSPDVFVVVERPGSSTQPSRAAGEIPIPVRSSACTSVHACRACCLATSHPCTLSTQLVEPVAATHPLKHSGPEVC